MDGRYARNMPALSEAECAVLREKHVCIVGCGGLGGYIIELLARVGVGALTVVDGDVFDVTNLNRQLLSDETVIGRNKADIAASRVLKVNAGVSVTAVPAFFTEENSRRILERCDLVVDALDSADARRVLASACAGRALRIVHGAIGGWGAQVAVVEPGSGVFDKLYHPHASGIPRKGNLSFIAAACASVQVSEAVKLLVGRPSVLQGKLLLMDLKQMEFTTIDLA